MSADKDAKLKALKLTMDRMDKAYGKGTVMKMGDAPVIEVESIPTGSLTLDIALWALVVTLLGVLLKFMDQRVQVKQPLHCMPLRNVNAKVELLHLLMRSTLLIVFMQRV